MIGVVNNSLETCKVLLDNGADVGAINIRSATAFYENNKLEFFGDSILINKLKEELKGAGINDMETS